MLSLGRYAGKSVHVANLMLKYADILLLTPILRGHVESLHSVCQGRSVLIFFNLNEDHFCLHTSECCVNQTGCVEQLPSRSQRVPVIYIKKMVTVSLD